MNETIIIVEDEENIAEGIRFNLESDGYTCNIITDGKDAIDSILNSPPDLILLDIMLPGASGFEVCDTIRKNNIHTPILFLTAKNTEDDKIRALKLGGDDYLTKPFSIAELIIRIQAMLRREKWYLKKEMQAESFKFGKNEIDFEAFTAVTIDGKVELTQKECMLLKLLVENEGKVVTRDMILDKIWGSNTSYTRTIDNIVLKLRKYFEKDPKNPDFIRSVYGAGYRFENN